MKNTSKKVIGLMFLSLIALSMFSFASADEGTVVNVPNSDKKQARIQAGEKMTYQFRQRTRIRINSSNTIEINMDCDAMNIGDKTVDIEILSVEGDADIELNMTCRQEETQLGVQAGKTVRNRVRARLNYGFVANITSNKSCNAKLGMEMTAAEAQTKTWAYLDEETDEWVPVESEYVDGELAAETDHFSVWTVVDSATNYTTYILIGVGAAAVIGIVFAVFKKKRQ